MEKGAINKWIDKKFTIEQQASIAGWIRVILVAIIIGFLSYYSSHKITPHTMQNKAADTEVMEGITSKCFLVKEQLIIDILKMCTGKTLDQLDISDAEQLTLIGKQGEENYKVTFAGKEIGNIVCQFAEFKIMYTFTPTTLKH